MYTLMPILLAVLFVFVFIYALFRRYKRCPSDRILVVYGKVGSNSEGNLSAKCIHGGAAFIWPIIQDYSFMDLTPTSIEVNLTNALSKQNIRIDVPSRFTVAISTEPAVMTNAAERLLGLQRPQIHDLAKDIIFGQLRLVVATMDIEEINSNRDKFLSNVAANVEAELKKIGLKLINVNLTDIKDESGYIEALGKEAAAKAINEAKKSVAEQERFGEIGKAEANKEKDIKIAETTRDRDAMIASANKDKEILIAGAQRDESIGKIEAERDTRIKSAEANSSAIQGENNARIQIAQSEATRREREAESLKQATAAEKVQAAKALEESYLAEQKAEAARAARERATQEANIVVAAEIQKQKAIIEAQAEAEKIRQKAKGEADAIFLKMEAEAKGMFEILTKQAEGMNRVVQAAGNNSKDAALLLIADKLPELVRMQTDAIKNIKIDKVTVWEGGHANGDGKGSTANFISGLYKSVPPLKDIFNMAGMDLPEFLGKEKTKGDDTVQVVES
ncbi:SPFH domain-containing protein [Chitinophaga horti]|uniref:SPFH domain-containing protein n=1 Tax=Chitinophaga horti TaxID=2920382 RepID=A0ABY6IXB7_9BACT|nr:flotillin family protein [Chitinophaga horti]UYQ92030.1 SPFH domain-containing protein [Chitinophaga horti]